jgi:hypothetical protein
MRDAGHEAIPGDFSRLDVVVLTLEMLAQDKFITHS